MTRSASSVPDTRPQLMIPIGTSALNIADAAAEGGGGLSEREARLTLDPVGGPDPLPHSCYREPGQCG